MADFELSVGGTVSTTALSDPASATRPSRLNAFAGAPHFYYRCGGGIVEVSARVGGIVVPDSALGGLLYGWTFAEHVSLAAPSIMNPSGESATAKFILPMVGSYLLACWRGGHGRVLLHLRRA